MYITKRVFSDLCNFYQHVILFDAEVNLEWKTIVSIQQHPIPIIPIEPHVNGFLMVR